ncbi:hypothetical protein M9Y10_045827 [Tritrichomonas musculus]|uniref:Protein kinase domain-containing protein n=1 Tax=Tritrichomonas musculus TaxID=1915356 RepID=A0ABR2JWB8_9EUKA
MEIDTGKLSFSEVNELKGIKIDNISGSHKHCFAVNDDKEVFGWGDNTYGCLGVGKRLYIFTKIETLNAYKITDAYAGFSHSFFKTTEGKILACGHSNYGELSLDSQDKDCYSEPVETKIANPSFCILGHYLTLAFIGCDPIKSPNRKVTVFSSQQSSANKASLLEENERLNAANQSLNNEVASLKKEVISLNSKITSLNDEVSSLKEKLKEYEKQEKRKEEKVPELQIYDVETIDNLTRIETIGRGAQSEVVKVGKQEIYALKILEADLAKLKSKIKNIENDDDEQFKAMKRFLQEYEIMNSLNHRNIVKAYGICFGDSTHPPSILIEYCPFNLNDVVNDLSNIEKVTAIYEISLAMNEVHSHGMIHRDLKPQNILLDKQEHVKLSDFGVSCIVDVSTQTQSITSGVGTLKFMAPELLQESTHYDGKVDVYSFGVVVFFILTGGQLPKINIVETAMGKKAKIPDSVNNVSRELINKCWSLKPEERPSFSEIIDAIKSSKFKLIDGVEKNISQIESFLLH